MGAGAGPAEGRGPALLRGEARSRQHAGLLGPGPGWTVFPFLPPVSWVGGGRERERGRAAWDPRGLIGRRL